MLVVGASLEEMEIGSIKEVMKNSPHGTTTAACRIVAPATVDEYITHLREVDCDDDIVLASELKIIRDVMAAGCPVYFYKIAMD